MPYIIHTSSVLWGIAAPKALLRNSHTLRIEQSIALPQPNSPPQIRFELDDRRAGEQARSGKLRFAPRGFRVRIAFDYQELSAAAAILWGKVFNGLAAGYDLLMIPHDDDALKLQFHVLPDGLFDLGYLGGKYLAHTATFNFHGVDLLPAIPLQTAVNSLSPRIHP